MEPWDWQDDAYKLDAESPLAISQSFLQDLSQAEAQSKSLFGSTPGPERVQSWSYGLSSSGGHEEGASSPPKSRFKRRRMLSFCSTSEFDVLCEAQLGPGNGAFGVSDEHEASASASPWYLRSGDADEPCSSVDQSDKWVDRCFGNREARDPCDQTRNLLDHHESQAQDNHDGNQLLYHNSEGEHADVSYPRERFGDQGSSHEQTQESSYEQELGLLHNQEHELSRSSITQAQEPSQGSQEQVLESREAVLCEESRDWRDLFAVDCYGIKKKGFPLGRPSPPLISGHPPTLDSECNLFLGSLTPLSSRPSSTTAGRKGLALARTRSSLAPSSVAYPFALLKPCGAQGDVTLHDINRRISGPTSSRSSKPEGGHHPHPVSPPDLRDAPGSGRSVLALTTIVTEGNGTITVMRTRG